MRIAFCAFLAVSIFAGADSAARASDWALRPELRKLESEWGAKAEDACVTFDESPARTPEQRESLQILELLGSVAPTRSLVALGLERAALLCQGDMFGQKAYYDNEAKLLAVKKDLGFWQKVVVLAHELEHLNQDAQGFKRTLDYDINEAVRFTFAVEADAQAISSLTAWRLRGSGHPEAWTALMSFVQYRPATRAFERAMAEGLSEEAATRAAFEGWLSSDWLTSSYRAQAMHMYLDDLDRTKRLQSYRAAPASFYDSLCRLPDGFSYDCGPAIPAAQGLSLGPTRPQRESDTD